MYAKNQRLGGLGAEVVAPTERDLQLFRFEGARAYPLFMRYESDALYLTQFEPEAILTADTEGHWVRVFSGWYHADGIPVIAYWRWSVHSYEGDITLDVITTEPWSPGASGVPTTMPKTGLASFFSSPIIWMGFLGAFYVVSGKGKR